MAEKAAQAQDILDALSPKNTPVRNGIGYGELPDQTRLVVAACDGHLFALAEPADYDSKWRSWSIQLLPVVPPGRHFRRVRKDRKRVELIAAAVGGAAEIVNACDAGREGEAIFHDLANDLGWSTSRRLLTRMWITSLEEKSIRQSFLARSSALDPKFLNQAKAADLRRKADWLFGINGVRVVTAHVPRLASLGAQHIGRVQTPVLGMIYQKALAARTFKSLPFFQVFLEFRGETESFKAVLKVEKNDAFGGNDSLIASVERARELERKIFTEAHIWAAVDDVNRVEEHAPPPFSLVELERACSRLYRWSARRTDRAAQACYRIHKCITYPRTESNKIPESLHAEAMQTFCWGWEKVVKREGMDALEKEVAFFPGPIVPDEKLESDHHAIMPLRRMPPATDADALVLWRTVMSRFMVAFSPPAVVDACSRVLVCDTGRDQFRALCDEGIVKSPGWLLMEDLAGNTKGYGLALRDRLSKKWVLVPSDGAVQLLGSRIHRGQTSPPDRHTYDTILGVMAQKKLGTAATRAEIVEGLLDHGYVESRGAELDVTPEGAHLTLELGRVYPRVLSIDIAQSWEAQLEKIGVGKRTAWPESKFVDEVLLEIDALMKMFALASKPDGSARCPFTGAPLVDAGAWWTFPGLPSEIHFPKVYAKRSMTPFEWVTIVTAPKERGAGPFDGFVSHKGKAFSASLAFHRKARNGRHIRMM